MDRYALEPYHNGARHLANGGDTGGADLAWPWAGYSGPPSPMSEFPGIIGGPRLQRRGSDTPDQHPTGRPI